MRPGAPVVAFTGDGGLGMTLIEIETAVRLRLRIVVIVFNDAALSLIKIKQRPAGQGGAEAVGLRPGVLRRGGDRAGGRRGQRRSEADLVAALDAALHRDGPTVIDTTSTPPPTPPSWT